MRGAGLLAPRYWSSWLAVGLLRLVALLPYPAIVRLGATLGGNLSRRLDYRRSIAETNLALAFSDEPAAWRRDLLSRQFRSLGITVLEFSWAWWARDRRLAGLARIEGLGHVREALAAGKGVILLTGHFTAFELGARLFSVHHPLSVTYREFRDPVLDVTMRRARGRFSARAIPRHDPRAMVRALRDNQVLWYAPDQDPGTSHSVFVPFFGVPAATLISTSRIARMTGAAVLPYVVQRLPDARGYRLIIQPPIRDFPSGDTEFDARRLNQWLERTIRSMPEQYLWVHRRYKTRPPGEPSLYPGKPRRLKKMRRSAPRVVQGS